LSALPGFIPCDKPITCLDIGANVGQTIDEVLGLYPSAEIWSFEPTPELVKGLMERYGSNPQVHIIGSALGDTDGTIPFHVSGFPAANSVLRPDVNMYEAFEIPLVEVFKKIERISVPVVRLDSWYMSALNKPVDIMKIDTQGFEYQVLQGSSGILCDKVRSVVLEVQYLPFYEKTVPFYRIFEFLYDNGFYLVDYFNMTKHGMMQLIESDVLFLNRQEFPYAH
jgi:FkbM family methyltransferase